MDSQLKRELFDEIRSAFTTVEHRTVDELAETLGSVFTSSDRWTDQGDCCYLEPMYGDAHRPLLRLMEQRPFFSKAAFTLKDVVGDDDVTRYAANALTRFRGHLLAVNCAMARFFLRFGLLPRCMRGSNSREKILGKIVHREQ